jgi:hypothetical protein
MFLSEAMIDELEKKAAFADTWIVKGWYRYHR